MIDYTETYKLFSLIRGENFVKHLLRKSHIYQIGMCDTVVSPIAPNSFHSELFIGHISSNETISFNVVVVEQVRIISDKVMQ